MKKDELIERLKQISRGATINTAKHYIHRLMSVVYSDCGVEISPADAGIINNVIDDMIEDVGSYVNRDIISRDAAREIAQLIESVRILVNTNTAARSVVLKETLLPGTKHQINKRIRKIENQLEKLKELLECL